MHLGKYNYYNILLDQTDEYYSRIPYHVLQWIRENRLPKLYDDTDWFNSNLSHWVIDASMELMNKNIKELEFPWQLHSQNVMLASSSRNFMTAEYSNRRSLLVQHSDNIGDDNYIDMLMKGQIKEKSTSTNRIQE